ncbi:cell wall-binding protein [Clostridium sp. ZBS15]|uniref:N-acetylmuramoyl-L-alanine amidase family protein n=1 Tax=Clostridium sp. ZBS15 TaxID=2949969 RepID=UPI00207B0904|nr:cell wall-binding protein [Clostridium sp. ZBS15]
MIKKLASSLLIVASVMAMTQLGVSAAWKSDSTGWWYTEANSYSTGWKQIDGFWYYFDDNGYMKTGWLQNGGKWYYLVPSGIMKIGWLKDGSKWYYLDDSGAMLTGKVSVGGTIYEFSNAGNWINTSENKTKDNVSKNNVVSRKPSEEKLKVTSDCSWFEENGNKYFKLTGNEYAKEEWNIDDNIYYFNEDGIMQTGEIIIDDGVKFHFGSDGKYEKCINKENWRLYANNGATTGDLSNKWQTKCISKDPKVKFDLDKYPLSMYKVYSSDPEKTKTHIVGKGMQARTVYDGAEVNGSTLNCRTNETIAMSVLEISNVKNWSTTPKLLIKASSSDKDIATCSFDLSYADGYVRLLHPYVITHKPGKTTITIDANGTTTSFDVVVTE